MSHSSKPLLFDSHAHLVADDQQKYPRNPMKRAANAPPRLPGVIGTPGGHHGPNPINEVPDAARVLQWMKEENVDGAVAVQKRMIYRYDNSYILDSSDAYPELFSAVVILDAEDPTTAPLVRQYIENHGLAGVRLFGGRQPDGSMPWLNSPMALKTWEVAQEYGLVMDLEVLAIGGGGPSIPTLIELSKQYPDVSIVLDHLLEPEMHEGKPGEFGMDERFEKLSPIKNISFKWTSINLDTCREEGFPNAPRGRPVRRRPHHVGLGHRHLVGHLQGHGAARHRRDRAADRGRETGRVPRHGPPRVRQGRHEEEAMTHP